MKHEWRKKEKELYTPKTTPTIIDIPSYNYITIEGEGNPNSEDFGLSVGSLYAISYAIKMNLKKEFFDYTVYPLEGIWSFNEEGKRLYQEGKSIVDLKDYLTYKVMIRQPEFVTKELFQTYQKLAYSKKKNEKILDVRLEQIEEGLSCQMLHIGSYDGEPASFKHMEEVCEQLGYQRIGKNHKEIYLSDPSKVAPEKLKTTLRFRVVKKT